MVQTSLPLNKKNEDRDERFCIVLSMSLAFFSFWLLLFFFVAIQKRKSNKRVKRFKKHLK